MARIRSVKPEFFQHGELFDAEQACGLPLRVAFIGLWTQCDREGRFEWRARQLKLNVLPYDACDFEAVLDSLLFYGFVQAYEVDGRRYGCIPSWLRHQCPNVRETASTIPAPCENSTSTVPARGEGKGREGKGKESVSASSYTTPPTTTKRAMRLPEDFTLTSERRAVAEAERLPADRTFAKFCDYWRSASGQSARKLDWDATWRNWCRTEADRSRGKLPGAVPLQPKAPPTEAEISAAQREAAEANRRELAAKIGFIATMPR